MTDDQGSLSFREEGGGFVLRDGRPLVVSGASQRSFEQFKSMLKVITDTQM